jgi:hypothetical protein
MRTEPELQLDDDASDAPVSLAGYLLTAERIVMGLVLLGFGLSGLMDFVPAGWLPAKIEAVDGALMQAGFAYPLLKGIEVLLEQYIGRKARRIPARSSLNHALAPSAARTPCAANTKHNQTLIPPWVAQNPSA